MTDAARSNNPEKPFFADILVCAEEIECRKADIKQLYSDARSAGIDVKVLRAAVRIALEDSEKRRRRKETEASAEYLLDRLGHLAGSPLGDAAVQRERA